MQADEILPKINAFKQYYVCKQELYILYSSDVAVKWEAKQPNVTYSAIFMAHNFADISRNARDLWSCV